jgi:hypothetical protein
MALSQKAIAAIHNAVDDLFNKVKVRYLGAGADDRTGSKKLVITHNPNLTLPVLYADSASDDGAKPKFATAQSLVDVAKGYLDASQAITRAKVVHAVDSYLRNAQLRGVETNASTVLGGQLAELWGTVTTDIKRILEAEATKARNIGALEGIVKVNAVRGIEDPTVAWLGPNDAETCEECKRVYLMPDKVTPKVYKLSQASSGHHHRGENDPKIQGLHPSCRHSLVTILPGYGFENGKISFISPSHDEYSRQNG